ncbi:MAG: hypothetical protein V2A53_09215 [bacterium]
MPIKIPANGDARVQVTVVESTDLSLSPNHLLLTPTFRLVLSVCRYLGYQGDAFIPLQIFNAFFGAASIILFLGLLRNLKVTASWSLIGSFLMAYTYGYWLHSREVESSIIPQFFMILSLWLLSCLSREKNNIKTLMVTIAGGISAAASVLYAMNYILILPAFSVFIYALGLKQYRLRPLAIFVVIFSISILIPYILGAKSALDTLNPKECLEWVSHHHLEKKIPGARQISAMNALRATSGLINTFVGDTSVTTAVKQILKGREMIYIPLSDWLRFFIGVLLIILLFIPLLYRPWSEIQRAIFLVTTVAFVFVGMFNIFWQGRDPQFWLPLIPFILMLTCTAAPKTISFRKYLVMWIIPALLLLLNMPYPVPTLWNPEAKGSPDWQKAQIYARMANPKDLLICSSGEWAGYIKAFGDFPSLSLIYSVEAKGERYKENLHKIIDQTLREKGKVYALGIFGKLPPDFIGAWEEIETVSDLSRPDLIKDLTSRYEVMLIYPDVFGDTLWQIKTQSTSN